MDENHVSRLGKIPKDVGALGTVVFVSVDAELSGLLVLQVSGSGGTAVKALLN